MYMIYIWLCDLTGVLELVEVVLDGGEAHVDGVVEAVEDREWQGRARCPVTQQKLSRGKQRFTQPYTTPKTESS